VSTDEVGRLPLRDRVEDAVDAAGNGYRAVSGELLVTREAEGDVLQAVAELARVRQGRGLIRGPERVEGPGAVVRLRFAGAEELRERAAAPVAEVLEGVRALLAGRRGDGTLRGVVSPNHLFVGEPLYSGGPADTVRLAETMPMPSAAVGEGVRVEVLDTGLFLDHPWWQRGGISAQSVENTSEPPDDDHDGVLDQQAGHGTFVAGIVAQQAPAAQIFTRAVLDSYGHGAEDVIAQAIRDAVTAFHADSSARRLVLNLSLGGYTDGDAPPLAILDALDTLPPEAVVVAAAGNDYPNCRRPFFPAALKRVLGVGALDEQGAPAPFSNRGSWVDACARGVRVDSSFFSGFDGPLTESPDPDHFEGFAAWSGTSFAAPLVAGRIAAVLSRQLDPSELPEVRQLLRRYGHPDSGDFGVGVAATVAELGLAIP